MLMVIQQSAGREVSAGQRDPQVESEGCQKSIESEAQSGIEYLLPRLSNLGVEVKTRRFSQPHQDGGIVGCATHVFHRGTQSFSLDNTKFAGGQVFAEKLFLGWIN